MGKELLELEEDSDAEINLDSFRATLKKYPIVKRQATTAYMDSEFKDFRLYTDRRTQRSEVTVIPVVVGAVRRVLKNLENGLFRKEMSGRIETIELKRSVEILRDLRILVGTQ